MWVAWLQNELVFGVDSMHVDGEAIFNPIGELAKGANRRNGGLPFL